ncbi:hypothetical protein SUBVAR_04150 [Subdoligranulum variabile DSM 15176]|uniref:Uncharacterized protein n=1 Tax=Subdoligranulum variabile DSM 15176 TaxID=411471 RepID=D1PII4_9FIRM|nr:hypothetical protein SUBVAR_04150 [Subdoligranulum variabile DSM 15176]
MIWLTAAGTIICRKATGTGTEAKSSFFSIREDLLFDCMAYFQYSPFGEKSQSFPKNGKIRRFIVFAAKKKNRRSQWLLRLDRGNIQDCIVSRWAKAIILL